MTNNVSLNETTLSESLSEQTEKAGPCSRPQTSRPTGYPPRALGLFLPLVSRGLPLGSLQRSRPGSVGLGNRLSGRQRSLVLPPERWGSRFAHRSKLSREAAKIADKRLPGAAPRIGGRAFRAHPRGESAQGGPTRRRPYRIWSKPGLVWGPQRSPRVPSTGFRVGQRAGGAMPTTGPHPRASEPHRVAFQLLILTGRVRGLLLPGPARSRGSFRESSPRERGPRRRVFPEMIRPGARSAAQAPWDSAAQEGQPIAYSC
ncbi:uncharacterized protein LOC108289238 [Cebus imitator]|uniref:uncharacterized protein LOC108289238 n=1 Tax=Cebus imitator TaxID=2715852 RepID=UPI000809C405|nr:uncharacterized protein LOC108289238 [Cebus imitator]